MQVNGTGHVFAGETHRAAHAFAEHGQAALGPRRPSWKHGVKNISQVAGHEFADIGDLNGLAHNDFKVQRIWVRMVQDGGGTRRRM